MIGRTGPVRARLDGIRARFERQPGEPSASVDAAVERLDGAVDRHFAKQAATRVTADRLVGALDVIPQGIVLADASGEIVFRNRTAAEYLSARHGDALVGSLITELIGTAVTGASTSRTIELFGPPRRSLQLRSVPLDAPTPVDGTEPSSPEATGAFLVIEDISERQRLEAVRRDFVANISHELKTPVGALGLLAETLADETDPEVSRRLAQRMQREAFRVARTIDDLLQLSQIEASEPPVQAPVPVLAIAEEAVDRTRSAADLASVDLVVADVSPALTVAGDRRQLVSAVANLADNAVKYSDPGSVVEIRARQVGDHVELCVIDQGIGIPARDQERVFERFYRVDRARSRDTGGTGLGLAIVRHVVANHHGEITVTSREGEGSTFTLRLPTVAPDRLPDRHEGPIESTLPSGTAAPSFPAEPVAVGVSPPPAQPATPEESDV